MFVILERLNRLQRATVVGQSRKFASFCPFFGDAWFMNQNFYLFLADCEVFAEKSVYWSYLFFGLGYFFKRKTQVICSYM